MDRGGPFGACAQGANPSLMHAEKNPSSFPIRFDFGVHRGGGKTKRHTHHCAVLLLVSFQLKHACACAVQSAFILTSPNRRRALSPVYRVLCERDPRERPLRVAFRGRAQSYPSGEALHIRAPEW